MPDETLAPSDRIKTSAITEQRQDVDESLKIAFSVYYHNMMVASLVCRPLVFQFSILIEIDNYSIYSLIIR